ncbi:MAG: hypothetical protein WCW17_00085 [Patescibacteria group bacterium]|jgi:hypothetical protein
MVVLEITAIVLFAAGVILRQYRATRWAWIATGVSTLITFILLLVLGLGLENTAVFIAFFLAIGGFAIDFLRGMANHFRQPRVGAAVFGVVVIAAILFSSVLQKTAISIVILAIPISMLLRPFFRRGGGGGGGANRH